MPSDSVTPTEPSLPPLDAFSTREAPAEPAPPSKRPTEAAPGPEACLHLTSTNGVCDSCGLPRVNVSRDWLDHGIDGSSSLGTPRLRVKGWAPEDKPPVAEDHDGWRERHRKIQQAKADHDQHALGKLYAPMLDSLHSGEQKPAVAPLDWDELEPAMVAELREWGKAHGAVKPGDIALMRLFDASCAIRVRLGPDGLFEMNIDATRVRSTWKEAEGRPRRAAAMLVIQATEELAQARRRELICVPDPL
jgi:hypothetical protein